MMNKKKMNDTDNDTMNGTDNDTMSGTDNDTMSDTDNDTMSYTDNDTMSDIDNNTMKDTDNDSSVDTIREILKNPVEQAKHHKESGSSHRTSKCQHILWDYFVLTMATAFLVVGVYVFKFPNHFSFGGVTGIAVVLGNVLPFSPSTINFVINMALLVLGFLFLGKSTGMKTVYVSLLTSVGLSFLEWAAPMQAPLTSQPVLELIFAIVMPAVSSAILFNVGASGGGTDIIAMILKKYSNVSIGIALFIVDLLIVLASCLVFDIQTGLFSFCGLLAKTLVIDDVIENINLCKYFTIICDDAEPICHYINAELNRSATIYQAQGAYTHKPKIIVLTVMKRSQAIQLRNFIKKTQPSAFMMITNSSEIIGKGFRGLN